MSNVSKTSTTWNHLREAIKKESQEELIRTSLEQVIDNDQTYTIHLLLCDVLNLLKSTTDTRRREMFRIYATVLIESPHFHLDSRTMRDYLKMFQFHDSSVIKALLQKRVNLRSVEKNGYETILDIACKYQPYIVICHMINGGEELKPSHLDYNYVLKKAKEYRNRDIVKQTYGKTSEYKEKLDIQTNALTLLPGIIALLAFFSSMVGVVYLCRGEGENKTADRITMICSVIGLFVSLSLLLCLWELRDPLWL